MKISRTSGETPQNAPAPQPKTQPTPAPAPKPRRKPKPEPEYEDDEEEEEHRRHFPVGCLIVIIILALVGFGGSAVTTTVLLGGWGLVATAAPVGWWTWLARTLPDDAEAGGGLMVAIIQLAIAAGATAGGLVFDLSGYRATFESSAALLVLAAALAFGCAMASCKVPVSWSRADMPGLDL